MAKLKKGYALYSDSVLAKDKYKVTSLPKIQFSTKGKARNYVRKHNLTNVKILQVQGLPARFID